MINGLLINGPNYVRWYSRSHLHILAQKMEGNIGHPRCVLLLKIIEAYLLGHPAKNIAQFFCSVQENSSLEYNRVWDKVSVSKVSLKKEIGIKVKYD